VTTAKVAVKIDASKSNSLSILKDIKELKREG
jgi:hypothetical protein